MQIPTIQYACARDNLAVVKALIAAGADVTAISGPDDEEEQSCLHRIAEHSGSVPMARLIAEAGCPLDHPDAAGFTPLHFAAWRDQCQLVHYLLDKGADREHRTASGSTPLITAVYHGCEEATRVLLERGVDVNARTKSLTTALDAARTRGFPRLIVSLLDHGAKTGRPPAQPVRIHMTENAGSNLAFSASKARKPTLPDKPTTISDDDFVHIRLSKC